MRIILIGLVLAVLTGCGSGKKSDENDLYKEIENTESAEAPISGEVIGSILDQIPSPLEISMLLKESGKKYNVAFLNPSENSSKYNSNYKKALNLGIYGTDLGYTNIYEQNNDGIKYMASIKDLANGLSIGQFFDIETVGRLATNSKNLDSLLLITTQNFNTINTYLQSQGRSNLSVLFLTGGWLEALHILGNTAKLNPDSKELRETIGGQKIILENIMLLLEFTKESDQNMANLLQDMQELKAAYDKVNITYTYKESTFEIVDGVMVIKDNSTSTIDITNEDIDSIRNITSSIRSKIIS